jgi:hypothetical protein
MCLLAALSGVLWRGMDNNILTQMYGPAVRRKPASGQNGKVTRTHVSAVKGRCDPPLRSIRQSDLADHASRHADAMRIILFCMAVLLRTNYSDIL